MQFFRDLYTFILVFFLVWKVKLFGAIDTTLLLAPFLVFLLPNISSHHSASLNRAFRFGLIVLLTIVVYVLVSYLFQGLYGSNFYVLKFVRVLLSFTITGAVLRYMLVIRQLNKDKLLKIIGLVLLVHPTVMVIQLLSIEVYEISMYLFGTEGYFHRFRVRGLMNGTSSGGQLLGYISGYFLFLAFYFRSVYWLRVYFFISVLFPISALAGFVPYCLYGLYGLLHRFSFVFKHGLYFIISLLIIVGLTKAFFNVAVIDNVFDVIRGRLGIFLGLEGDLSQGNPFDSFGKLMSTMNLPGESVQFLFGNFQPSKSLFSTTVSDSGYISNLHAFGVVGTMFLLLTVLAFTCRAKSWLLSIFFVSFLIVFYKNDMIYGRVLFDYFFLIYFMSSVYSNEFHKPN